MVPKAWSLRFKSWAVVVQETLWKKTQGRKLLGQSIGKIHHDDDDDDDDGDDRGENTTQYFSGIMIIPHIYIYIG